MIFIDKHRKEQSNWKNLHQQVFHPLSPYSHTFQKELFFLYSKKGFFILFGTVIFYSTQRLIKYVSFDPIVVWCQFCSCCNQEYLMLVTLCATVHQCALCYTSLRYFNRGIKQLQIRARWKFLIVGKGTVCIINLDKYF